MSKYLQYVHTFKGEGALVWVPPKARVGASILFGKWQYEVRRGKQEKPIQVHLIKVTAVGYRGSLLPKLLRSVQNASQRTHQYIHQLLWVERYPLNFWPAFPVDSENLLSKKAKGRIFMLEIRRCLQKWVWIHMERSTAAVAEIRAGMRDVMQYTEDIIHKEIKSLGL